MHGTSAHLHQPSLLFPGEPLVRLIKARFMHATQSNLTHVFFSVSVGFSNVFRMAERTKPFVHLCCGGGGMVSRGREKIGRGRHEGWGWTKGMNPSVSYA